MANLEQFLDIVGQFFSGEIEEEEMDPLMSGFENKEELWGFFIENL